METNTKIYTARFGKNGRTDSGTVEDCLRAFLASNARTCTVSEWSATSDGMMIHRFGDWSGTFTRQQAREYMANGQTVLIA